MLSFSEKRLQVCLTPGCTTACVLKPQLLNIVRKHIRFQNTSARIYARTAELLPFIAVKEGIIFLGEDNGKTKNRLLRESLSDDFYLHQ